MISLMAVTNRAAAGRIQVSLLQQGIKVYLQEEDPLGLAPTSATPRLFIHILVAETDLARAREILHARLESA